MKNAELVAEALMILPILLGGVVVLWLGLGFLVYELCKWLKDWR